MPCNISNCNQYSPLEDPTIGVLMTKKQFPYPATGTINAPSWDRDRVMYDFEDICESVNPLSRYSSPYGPLNNGSNTTPVVGSDGYNFNETNRGGAYSGKLYQPITTSSWWESYQQCGGQLFGGYQGSAQKFRYWDNYPGRLSFEPLFSDTWFYYLFDTYEGVTGTPCATYCFTVTRYEINDNSYTSYNMIKRPYECPCHPDETYLKYTLEDGQTNPSHNADQYPTFWSVGTKRQGIAYQYQNSVNAICRNVNFNTWGRGGAGRKRIKFTFTPESAVTTCGGVFEISELSSVNITKVIKNLSINTTYSVTAEPVVGSGYEGSAVQLGLKKSSTTQGAKDVIESDSASSIAMFADFEGSNNDSDDAVLFVSDDGKSGRFYSSNKRNLSGRQTWDIKFRVDSVDNTIPILAYRPREGQEKFVLLQGGATKTKVFSLTGNPMFGTSFTQFPNEYKTTQNVTFSNGMVLDMTFECSRRDTTATTINTYTPTVVGTSTASMFVKINSIISAPTGGWPQYVEGSTPPGGIELALNPISPLTNTLVTGAPLGYIVLFPSGHPKNPGQTKSGVPRDYLLSESKFEGGYYAITTHPGWGSWFRSYAVWTNNKQNTMAGRNMTCGMRKIPVSVAGTYTLEIGNDNTGNWILQSWGRNKSDDGQVLSTADENREIYQFHGYDGGQSTITFTTIAAGYINIIVDVFNASGGTWNSNPGGFAAVLRRGSTIVWTTRDQTGSGSVNFGDAFRGMTLREAGFVDAWNGVSGIPFQSVNGNCWKSGSITTYKDYEIPGGLKLRMKLQSTDNNDGTFGTVWKIEKIIESGKGYGTGVIREDGEIDFIDQNKFTLFYPTKSSPNRISICLVLATTVEDADDLDDVTTRLSPGNTVNGWIVTDVKESNDELNMHLATLKPGTSSNDFSKDASYVANNGCTVKVVAGWGIKDRAALIGLYEFRRKEIEYGVGIPTEGMPFSPELIRPICYAEVSAGKVTNIVIEGRGRGLQHQNITEPRLCVSPPPTQFNHVLFDELIRGGTNVESAKRRATGVGEIAQLKPKYEQGRLVSVAVVNGGSGYSSSKPPDVYVPYISRNKTVVTRSERDPDTDPGQDGQKTVFSESEAFKNMANTEYGKYDVNINERGVAKLGNETKTKGYSWDSYKTDTTENNKAQSYVETTTDLQGMQLADTKRTSRFDNRGVDKSFITVFKTGGKADKNKDVINVKSKTSDKITLPSSDKKDNGETSSAARVAGNEAAAGLTGGEVLNEKDTNTLSADSFVDSSAGLESKAIKSGNSASDDFTTSASSQSDSSAAKTSGLANPSQSTAKYEREGNYIYDKKFKDFYTKQESGNPTNMEFEDMEWSSTAGQNDFTGKTPKNHKGSDSYTGKSVVDQIEEQEKKTDDSLDEMWQRDQEENRIGSWQNTEMRVTKQSFFNLPCRSDKEVFLMRRFCPDPRPWTTIHIRLGVVKLPIDVNDPTRTHCKECLEQTRPDLVSIRSAIRTQFNDNLLTIEDAYCVDLYGLPGASFYGGTQTGYGSTTYLVDFNNGRNVMGTNPYTLQKLRKLTGYQDDQSYLLDGCRSYDIYGQVLIYHSLTNETKLWATSVASYGNPYDFRCGRYYGDQGEEDLYSTEVAGDVIDDNAADMPGYQDFFPGTPGAQPDFPVSKTIPLEGY